MGLANWIVLLVTRPLEFKTLLQFYLYHSQKRDIKALKEHAFSGWDRASMRRCWEFLDLTSRSFAAVIKELDGDLARTICLFYLVLRGLDTIEDDMTIPDGVKQPLLRSFHNHTVTPGWTFDGSGPNEKDRQLLVEFNTVVEEVNRLLPEYKDIIIDICQKMQTGMADFAHKAATSGSTYLDTIEEYDLYCHYVAGLVGEGLSRLFAKSGKEEPWLATQLELSNSVGLLLQKTNIIRDYREDCDEKRYFWPREIWAKEEYGFKEMEDMYGTDDNTLKRATSVQSEMILNALGHTTDALDYLRLLKNQSVFNFCAIPAVMAIATLELCFMNKLMFQRNIKIRKAEAAALIMRSTNPREVGLIFREYARRLHAKAIPSDPNFIRISVACGKIEAWYEQNYPSFIHLSSHSPGKQFIEIDTLDRRAKVVFAEQALDRQLKNRSLKGDKSNGAANGHAANGVSHSSKDDPPPNVSQLTSYAVGGYSLILVLCMGFLWAAMK